MVVTSWLPAAAGTAAQGTATAPAGGPAGQAYALRMSGRAEEARKGLEDAAAKAPREPAIQFELSRTRLYLFDFAGAAAAATEAARGDPHNPRYHAWAGLALTYRGIDLSHKDDAVAVAEAHASLALACCAAGRFDEARQHMDKSLALSPARLTPPEELFTAP